MNPESEKFVELRRLLSLKRHESPPPGYFQNFSGRVLARIEAERQVAALPWWQRMAGIIGPRPALAFAYSLALGGVVILGLSIANDGSDTTAELPMPVQPTLLAQPATAPAPAAPQLSIQPVPFPQPDQPSSITPVLNPDAAPAGLFNPGGFLGWPNQGGPQPVSYPLPAER